MAFGKVLFVVQMTFPLFLTFCGCDVRQDIIAWWTKMSEQKPIRCIMNSELQRVLPLPDFIKEEFRYKIMEYCSCNEKEARHVDFRGTIREDGKFQGPGKVKLKAAGEGFADICIRAKSFENKEVRAIVGVFKNGYPEGQSKVIFADKSMMIANFSDNGGLKGLVREFNADGKLEKVYHSDIRLRGHSWMKNDDFFIQSDVNFLKLNDEFNAVIIPIEGTKSIWVGNYHPGIKHLSDAKLINLNEFQNESCFPNLKWNVISTESKTINLNNFQEAKNDFHKDHFKNLKSPEEQFDLWLSHANNFYKRAKNGGIENMFGLKPEVDTSVNHAYVIQPFLSKVSLIPNNNDDTRVQINMSVWNGPIQTWIANDVAVDKDRKLHGICTLYLNKEHHNKTGRHDFMNWSPIYIGGRFSHGNLEGLAVIITFPGEVIYATFKEGVFHGPCHSYGAVPLNDMVKRGFEYDERFPNGIMERRVGFFGRMRNGQVFGRFWIGMMGQGFLYGQADEKGLASGLDIAYIYPDGVTALKGHFEDKIMKQAQHVQVKNYVIDEHGLLKVESFSPILEPERFFTFDPCTKESFGGLAPDPYEEKTVKVGQSSVPNSGQGVFALRDIPKGRVAAFYSLNLYKEPGETLLYHNYCNGNTSRSEEERRRCVKYSVPLSAYKALFNLLPELDNEVMPTTGPKINHHFYLNNTVIMEGEHPRFGHIVNFVSTKDIKQGEELFADYAYFKLPFPFDHPWYWKAKEEFEKARKCNEK